MVEPRRITCYGCAIGLVLLKPENQHVTFNQNGHMRLHPHEDAHKHMIIESKKVTNAKELIEFVQACCAGQDPSTVYITDKNGENPTINFSENKLSDNSKVYDLTI